MYKPDEVRNRYHMGTPGQGDPGDKPPGWKDDDGSKHDEPRKDPEPEPEDER